MQMTSWICIVSCGDGSGTCAGPILGPGLKKCFRAKKTHFDASF